MRCRAVERRSGRACGVRLGRPKTEAEDRTGNLVYLARTRAWAAKSGPRSGRAAIRVRAFRPIGAVLRLPASAPRPEVRHPHVSWIWNGDSRIRRVRPSQAITGHLLRSGAGQPAVPPPEARHPHVSWRWNGDSRIRRERPSQATTGHPFRSGAYQPATPPPGEHRPHVS